jgi:hypothetical protein
MRARAWILAAFVVGCDSPTGPPPVTQLEIHAVPMIVPECDGQLTAWSVKVRETGEHHTSDCEQEIVVSDLQPYQPYTLEIAGYAAEGICWSGNCDVSPAPGLGLADCPRAVTYGCADAGD